MKTDNFHAQKAKAHYENVKVRLAAETQAAIKASKIYGPQPIDRNFRDCKFDSTTIQLVDEDSVSCVFNQPTFGKVAILNYASYKFPGGLYLQGSHAQEEALCHESNLFPILLAFDKSYYEWNRKNLNKALYLNRAIYTPGVVFEHNGKTKAIDVITCAAPNANTAVYRCRVSKKDNEVIFEDRIRFMFAVAEANEVDTLILGAWGCGVFGQNPIITCQLMNDALLHGCFGIKQIYYAIPGGSYNGNYVAFEEELNKYGR